MPFELTHLAVGIQVRPDFSPSYLAGLIYPDIRYPAQIDRVLTHSLEPLTNCKDTNFIDGARCHLMIDQIWDELLMTLQIQKPNPSMSDENFIRLCKLVHERIAFDYLQNIKNLQQQLGGFELPAGLPVTTQQWNAWVKAIIQYLTDGPTTEGWVRMITAMDFLAADEIKTRVVLLEQILPQVKESFAKLHLDLVRRVGEQSAGVARS